MVKAADQEARLRAAADAVRRSPEKEAAWNELEHLAATAQKPEGVRELYLEILGRDPSPALVATVGKRALRFHDEWFGGDGGPDLVDLCRKILTASPADEAALARLTVALTVEARWAELCEVYDRAIAAAPDAARRGKLLEEALEVARDFASDVKRATGYLRQLCDLRPDDVALRAALERLLEREGRHAELVELWRGLLPRAPNDEAIKLRRRIADACLGKLGDARGALSQARALLAAGAPDAELRGLFERICSADGQGTDAATRLAALTHLLELHDAAGRAQEAIQALETALAIAPAADQPALRHSLAERMARSGHEGGALEHALAALEHDPADALALERAKTLADRQGAHARFAAGLVAAADRASGPARDVLRLELAAVRSGPLGDAAAAAQVLEALLESADDPAHRLGAARSLRALYEKQAAPAALSAVLERLAEIEPDESERRAALVGAARAAEAAGDDGKAEAAWRRCIALDPTDLSPLDALSALLERTEKFGGLVELLATRRTIPAARADRRADLAKIARLSAERLGDLDGAIAAWRELAAEHGEDDEAVGELTDLLTKAGRTVELCELLDRASARRSELLADSLADLGEARAAAGDGARSVDAFARALDVDPRHERARAGLRSLLSGGPASQRAAVALGRAHERAAEPVAALDLLELRLSATTDLREQEALLAAAARTAEVDVGDSVRALGYVARALQLAPDDLGLERELERLAESTSRWDVAAGALEQAIAAIEGRSPDDPRAGAAADRGAQLSRKLGAVREALGDSEAALAALVASAALQPDRAAVHADVARVAAARGRWDEATRSAVRAASLGHPTPLAEIEHHAARAGAWDVAAAALEAAIDDVDDLAPSVARTLELAVMTWHEDRRGDLAAAELALRRSFGVGGATEIVPGSRTAAAKLADLQRRRLASASEPAGGWAEALHDTLLLLADLSPEDLGPLREAAALEGIDAGRRAATLERLFSAAGQRWAQGEGQHAALGRWALEQLEAWLAAAGDHERMYSLHQQAAAWARDPAEVVALRRKAGMIANESLLDPARAEARARDVLELEPGDGWALALLAERYEAAGRIAEHAALLRHELSLAPPLERRLALRLRMAELLGVLADRGERVGVLAQNLSEHPGHDATLEALCSVLEAAGERARLADVLEEQASQVEAGGDGARAALLWSRAAEVAERDLGDAPRAASCHERAVRLSPQTTSIDALARLATARADHAAAAHWLERRLTVASPAEHAAVALDLARAHVAAGHERRAVTRLEKTVSTHPDADEARILLAELYRKAEAWAPLATLLADASEHAPDDATRLAHLREAAAIHAERLGAPERATELLERALALAPEDRWIRTTLADAFAREGRAEQAAQLLESLIADFGRRRTPERARLHKRLADVRRAQGKLDEAIAQLDAASSGSAGDASLLAALGSVAAEAGQLERAEQAYRTLLLVVRRQPPGDDETAVGPSEILFALSQIAARRGQADQARELADSARVAATKSSLEARRFVRAAIGTDPRLCLDVLAEREATESDTLQRARLASARADILEATADGAEEALRLRLAAIDGDPDSATIHAAARGLARKLGKPAAYVGHVATVVEGLRRTEDARRASALLLAMGAAYEDDLGDLEQAADAFTRAEALGEHPAEAKAALARLAGMRGVSTEQRRRLEELLEMEDAPAELRNDALYRLADVDLASDATRARGLARLEEALEADPQHARAARSLGDALASAPDETAAWALYERVTRVSGDAELLLAYLERRASHPAVTLEEVHEGVELAERLGDETRVEALLARAVERAGELPVGPAGALWALDALADRAMARGDVTGAVRWLRDGARAADRQSGRSLRAAAIAAGPGGDLHVAAELYGELLERDPTARGAYEPMIGVLRQLRDHDALGSLVSTTLGVLPDPQSRNALRLDQARFLLGEGRSQDAVELLRDALTDDPDDATCAVLLAETLERSGDTDGLADLLSNQLDAAKDRSDAAAVAALSLRLASVLRAERRDDAVDVLRAAVEWAPSDPEPVRALLALLGPDDDARERADLLEKLLAFEQGPGASRLARDLAALRRELDDDDGYRRALTAGLASAPDDGELDALLEAHCRERALWDHLVELLGRRVQTALATGGPQVVGTAPMLREMARIQRSELGSPGAAAGYLVQALRVQPHDLQLVDELVAVAREAGDLELAIAEVERVLSNGIGPADAVRLERELAELRVATGRHDDAIGSLERAFALGGPAEAPRLLEALEAARERASRGGDLVAERSASARLVEVLLAIGDTDGARDTLAMWHEADPTDRDAIRRIREIDAAAERWDAVADACRKLIELESGRERIDAAIRLADACERAGDPGAARDGLEQALSLEPTSDVLRTRLHALYESIGAWHPLGLSILSQASATEDPARQHELMSTAGRMLLEQARDPGAALEPLRKASELAPTDHATTLLLLDALVAGGLLEEALKRTEAAITTMGRRRSPELAAYQHRMARIAEAYGDVKRQREWLTAAMETDRQSGEAAADLAELAIRLDDMDTALKALRVVTMIKTPCRMSRAVAFLRQAQIAHRLGDAQKALVFARRARTEDSSLAEAVEFLRQLGEA